MAGRTAGSPLKYIFMGTNNLFDNLYHHETYTKAEAKGGKMRQEDF